MTKMFEFLYQTQVGLLLKCTSSSVMKQIAQDIVSSSELYVYYICKNESVAQLYMQKSTSEATNIISLFICKDPLFQTREDISIVDHRSAELIMTEEKLELIDLSTISEVVDYFDDSAHTYDMIHLNSSIESIVGKFNNRYFYVKNELGTIIKLKCFDYKERSFENNILSKIQNGCIPVFIGKKEIKDYNKQLTLYFYTETDPHIYAKYHFYFKDDNLLTTNFEIATEVGKPIIDSEYTELKMDHLFTTMRAAYLA